MARAYYPNRSKLHSEVEQGRLVGQGLQVLQRPGWLVRGGQHTLDGAAAVGCRRTIGGILEASSSPPGLKIDEEGFQNVLRHRPEVALGEDGEFVSGDHVLGGGIKVAGYVTAVVALEVLQAHPTQGGFREIRACEKRGQLGNFAVDMVNIEASGF